MKHGAPQSAKFKKLVRIFRQLIVCESVSIDTVTIGILERLWHATINSAPQGDIGRVDDDVIAELVGWHGEPELLIDSLVDAGWLDRCPEHRLVIHDWKDHAPNFLKGNLTKHNREFCDSTLQDVTKPNPTQPNRQSRGSNGTKQSTKQTAKQKSDTLKTAFDKFWSVVHRKEGVGKAKTAFNTALKSVAKEKGLSREAAAAWIIERMLKFAASPQASDEVKGTLHPATWLNQARYDDDDSIWQQSRPTGIVTENDSARRIV